MFRITHLAGISGLVLLTGCSLNVSGALFGESVPHTYAVGDNPYAVKEATAILKQGGNAVDAATAMFFALTVTDPASAGLGGGGVCLVHNPEDDSNTEYAFLPGTADGAYATPAAMKGFALMHYQRGLLPWQKLVSAGEGLAHTGFPMTEALHKRLEANLDKIRLDASLAQEFLDESGKLKPVGTRLYAQDLADTLTKIRMNGPQSMYTGALAKQISGYSAAQGLKITPEKLAAYRLMAGQPDLVDVNGTNVWLPDAKSGAGAYARTLISKASGAEKKSAFIAALKTLKTGETADYGATGFSVMDSHGMSVSCTVTMNAPFGTARTVPGTGITLAPAKTDGHAYLAPVIAAYSAGSQADMTGTAAGGPASNATIVATLIRASRDEAVYARSQIDTFGGNTTDLANIISCDGDSCAALPDPKGEGYGLTATLPKAK